MARPYCPTPECCTAPKRGICPCQVDALLGHRERMKALHAARGHISVPDHLKSYAAKLRSCGIRADALLAGCDYACVDNIDDALVILSRWGLIRQQQVRRAA